MQFKTRKLITPADLNPRGYLHGRQLLKWVDEEGGIHAGLELNSNHLQAIAGLMWISHLIASTERKTVWDATKKKSSYREEFPKK